MEEEEENQEDLNYKRIKRNKRREKQVTTHRKYLLQTRCLGVLKNV